MLKGASYIAFSKFSKSQDGENFPSPQEVSKIFQKFSTANFQKKSTANFQTFSTANFQKFSTANFQKFSTLNTVEFCYQQRWQKLIQYQNEKQYIAEASENFLSTRI